MWRNITFSNFSESSWQERLSYQYPQRFVKFDPEHLKYLLPGNIPCQQFASPSGSNAPKFTIKVVSGKFFSTLKTCFQYWYVWKWFLFSNQKIFFWFKKNKMHVTSQNKWWWTFTLPRKHWSRMFVTFLKTMITTQKILVFKPKNFLLI